MFVQGDSIRDSAQPWSLLVPTFRPSGGSLGISGATHPASHTITQRHTQRRPHTTQHHTTHEPTSFKPLAYIAQPHHTTLHNLTMHSSIKSLFTLFIFSLSAKGTCGKNRKELKTIYLSKRSVSGNRSKSAEYHAPAIFASRKNRSLCKSDLRIMCVAYLYKRRQ